MIAGQKTRGRIRATEQQTGAEEGKPKPLSFSQTDQSDKIADQYQSYPVGGKLKDKADLLAEAQSVLLDKIKHEKEASRLLGEMGKIFVQIHEIGGSDQEIATSLGKISRTRVQQLRSRSSNV